MLRPKETTRFGKILKAEETCCLMVLWAAVGLQSRGLESLQVQMSVFFLPN